MLNTYMVYVENKPGVLTRVASLFRRRAFNIDSLTVGRTEKPEVSRMTITVDADQDQARRIEANLYKLVNVLLVDDITNKPSLLRDLALIKVTATQQTRSQILDIANVFKARVLDIALEFGKGLVLVGTPSAPGNELLFSTRRACPKCSRSFRKGARRRRSSW